MRAAARPLGPTGLMQQLTRRLGAGRRHPHPTYAVTSLDAVVPLAAEPAAVDPGCRFT